MPARVLLPMKFGRFEGFATIVSLLLACVVAFLPLNRDLRLTTTLFKLFSTLPYIFAALLTFNAHNTPVPAIFLGLFIQTFLILLFVRRVFNWCVKMFQRE